MSIQIRFTNPNSPEEMRKIAARLLAEAVLRKLRSGCGKE